MRIRAWTLTTCKCSNLSERGNIPRKKEGGCSEQRTREGGGERLTMKTFSTRLYCVPPGKPKIRNNAASKGEVLGKPKIKSEGMPDERDHRMELKRKASAFVRADLPESSSSRTCCYRTLNSGTSVGSSQSGQPVTGTSVGNA